MIFSNVYPVCVCVFAVAWSCPILCGPRDCSPPDFSAHGIFQASGVPFSTPGDLPDPGIELTSPALADSLPLVPPGKLKVK